MLTTKFILLSSWCSDYKSGPWSRCFRVGGRLQTTNRLIDYAPSM